jgi:hypothetical protein
LPCDNTAFTTRDPDAIVAPGPGGVIAVQVFARSDRGYADQLPVYPFARYVEGGLMSVYSIWESRFTLDASEEGLEVTRAIWADMASFDGYLDHEIVQDLNDMGHLFVISRWASQEAADAAVVYRERMPGAPINSLTSRVGVPSARGEATHLNRFGGEPSKTRTGRGCARLAIACVGDTAPVRDG